MRKAAPLLLFALLIAITVLANGQSGSSVPSTSGQSSSAAGTSSGSTGSPVGTASGTSTTPAGNSPTSGTTSSATSANVGTDSSASSPNGSTSRPLAASALDQLAPNTLLHATLDTLLSTKTSKPGDRFTATVAEPVRGANGMILIPSGARVEGEIADSEEGEAGRALSAMKDRGKLSVRFRDVLLPTGESLPLSAHLVSLNSTNGLSTKRTDDESRASGSVAAGSQPGSGAAFGPPLKGLAVGNLAGGGYIIATKDKEKKFNLPAQTGMVIRLDQPPTATLDR